MALLVSSCIFHEDSPVKIMPGTITNNKYYISLSVSIPNSTRNSQNSNDGYDNETLAGTDLESTLENADLYFCIDKKVNLQLSATNINRNSGLEGKGVEYVLTALIPDISKLKALVGQKVELFIVGNHDKYPSLPPIENVSEATFNIKSLDENPVGEFKDKGKLLPFVNADSFIIDDFEKINQRNEKDILEALQNLFSGNGPDKTYRIKSLDLERAVARIDFADKARLHNNEAWLYKVGNSELQLKLSELQIFNVNTESFLFRHTSSGNREKASENLKMFGEEKDLGDCYIWVANPSWINNKLNLLNTLEFSNKESKKVIKGINDSKGKIKIEELSKNLSYLDNNKTYYPWRYVSENTLKSITTELETNATGLAFTFLILNSQGKGLKYSDSQVNYPAGINNKKHSDSQSTGIIKITDSDGSWIEVEPSKDNCYYLTYYAFIVHNDDKDPDNIGPMEYAVVRNNVYQLSVNSVQRLPDPNQPESLYLNLDINILSWKKHDINMSW